MTCAALPLHQRRNTSNRKANQMTSQATNYQTLIRIFPDLSTMQPGAARKLESGGYMPLNLDVLERDRATMLIALSHYWKHDSGDMMADPDMQILLDLDMGKASAQTFQQDGFPPVWCDVGEDMRHARKLDGFLAVWLNNLWSQGFRSPADARPTELTPEGEQHVIPGCERRTTAANPQADLFR